MAIIFCRDRVDGISQFRYSVSFKTKLLMVLFVLCGDGSMSCHVNKELLRTEYGLLP